VTTYWKVGEEWLVGTAEKRATALEVTIGNANECTVGLYNFLCFGFYLDATVGPLVEFIAPFPYSLFPGILMEIILPQKQILAATVVAGAAAAAGGLVGEEGGVGAGIAAGAAVGGLAAFGASAAIAAADMFEYSACQMDIVYGNYFFTVYGDCFDWQKDHYHHHAADHFEGVKQQLRYVTGSSTDKVLSETLVAGNGITVQAGALFSGTGNIATVYGTSGLVIAATSLLTIEAMQVSCGAPTISLQSPAAQITLAPSSASLSAANCIYLNGEVTFTIAPLADTFTPCEPPVDAMQDAAAALADAVHELEAALGTGGH